MSFTKLEKTDGELISQADINSEKFSPKSSQCSCIDCDSIGCFSKRNKIIKNRCQCDICGDIRTCSVIPNTSSHDNRKELENATKKFIREVVTRETIESLKRVTETMYQFGNDEPFKMLTERQSKLSDKKEIPTPIKSQISNKKECCKHNFISRSGIKNKNERSKQSSVKQSQSSEKRECCRERPIAQVPSTDIVQPRNDNNTATKLSAQVMNVPYEELNETVPSLHELTEQHPLSTKLNIFKRLKEIYEACSCKVCECISSKPRFTRELREDFCKCKPCDCIDCVKMKKKIEEKIKCIPHSGCPCIRCDRKDCRGIAKNACEPVFCDCNYSDNIQREQNISNICICEPCQCGLIDFRTPKTVKLGQVDEIIQKETCECTPCKCIECNHIYNRTNPTVMCTTSTEMAKHYNCRCNNCRIEPCKLGETETCLCHKHNRTMRKSFVNNYNGYDIRTAIVDNTEGPFNKRKQSNIENQNTVALFMSLATNYPSNLCNNKICKCNECECIVCAARDNSLRSQTDHFRHQNMSVHNTMKIPTQDLNSCKCNPCECEICSNRSERLDCLTFEKNCICDVCDCLNCNNASMATSSFPTSSLIPYGMKISEHVKPIRSMNMNKNCDCHPCDCNNCRKLFSCSSSVKFYSNGKRVEKKTSRRVRKVLLITPSTSESRFKSQKTSSLSVKPSVDDVFRHDMSNCHAISCHACAAIRDSSRTNNDKVCQLYRNSKKCNVISDNDVNTEIISNLSNPVLETASFKSFDDLPVLNYSRNMDVKQANKNHKIFNDNCDEITEMKRKPSDNIFLQDSDESLPVFWTCRNEMSYPRTNQRGFTCKKTKNDMNGNVITNDNDINPNEITREIKQTHQNLKDKAISKHEDAVTEHLNHLYFGSNHNYPCDDDPEELHVRPHKYATSFINTINNSNLECGKSSTVKEYDISIDYERATRVLCEAKAFSSKLMKMLDSFETANKQFESASEKFKVLHESLLNINESELYRSRNSNKDRLPKPIFKDRSKKVSENHHDCDQCSEETVKNDNEPERDYEQLLTKPSKINDNLQNTEVLIISTKLEPKASHNVQKNPVKTDDMNIQENERNKVPVYNSTVDQHQSSMSKLKSLSIKFNNSVENQISKQPQLQVSNSYILDAKQNLYHEEPIKGMTNKNDKDTTRKHTLGSVMSKVDSVFDNTSASPVTCDKEEKIVPSSKERDDQDWKIFKKNLYLDIACSVGKKKSIFQSLPLELDMKKAIQAISLQSANSENISKAIPRRNEALANLQNEVNSLLNMPLLQIRTQWKYGADSGINLCPKSKLDLELKSMSSVSSQTYNQTIAKADKEVYFNDNAEAMKISCDQLKANFVGVRRVSDHTVLVKWDVPKRIKDVQGYELLVDGRAVQQIFSPSRRTAVLTCLPRAARVLLSVRTLAAGHCGHSPTTSIVYRPRK